MIMLLLKCGACGCPYLAHNGSSINRDYWQRGRISPGGMVAYFQKAGRGWKLLARFRAEILLVSMVFVGEKY